MYTSTVIEPEYENYNFATYPRSFLGIIHGLMETGILFSDGTIYLPILRGKNRYFVGYSSSFGSWNMFSCF